MITDPPTVCLRSTNPRFRPLHALGRIAAGTPLEAIEDRQRGELLAMLTAPGRCALRVGDYSMCEAGIFAGDFIIVQRRQGARDGDLIVTLLNREQVIMRRIR